MQVTAVDGNTVTGDLGILENQGGAPDGQNGAPVGETPSGQTPPEKPDGQAPSDEKPDGEKPSCLLYTSDAADEL